MWDLLDTRQKLKIAASIASLMVGAGILLGSTSLSGGVKDEKKKSGETIRPIRLDKPLEDQPQEETEPEDVAVDSEEVTEEEEVEEENVILVELSEIEGRWKNRKKLALGCMHLKFSFDSWNMMFLNGGIKTESSGFMLETTIIGGNEGDKVTTAKYISKSYELGPDHKWTFNKGSDEYSVQPKDTKMDDFAVRGRKFSRYMKLKDRNKLHEEAWIWLEHDPELGTEKPQGSVEEPFLKDVEQWTYDNPFKIEKQPFKDHLNAWYSNNFKERKGIWQKDVRVKNCNFMFANSR